MKKRLKTALNVLSKLNLIKTVIIDPLVSNLPEDTWDLAKEAFKALLDELNH